MFLGLSSDTSSEVELSPVCCLPSFSGAHSADPPQLGRDCLMMADTPVSPQHQSVKVQGGETEQKLMVGIKTEALEVGLGQSRVSRRVSHCHQSERARSCLVFKLRIRKTAQPLKVYG